MFLQPKNDPKIDPFWAILGLKNDPKMAKSPKTSTSRSSVGSPKNRKSKKTVGTRSFEPKVQGKNTRIFFGSLGDIEQNFVLSEHAKKGGGMRR